MQKYANLHSVGFFKKRPVYRRSQSATSYVAEKNNTVELERVYRPMKLGDCGIRGVHRDRRKSFESIRMPGNEIGVGVVKRASDFRLLSLICEKDVRRRQGDHLTIDSDAVHVFEPLCHVAHRGSDAEKACPPVRNDCSPGRILCERKLRRSVADQLEEEFGVVVCVNVNFHRVWIS